MNADKRGVDIRCSVEVHLAGRHAVAADVDAAVEGAVDRVLRVIDKQFGRQYDRARHTSAAGNQGF